MVQQAMNTFIHGGATGDLIFSLPTIKAMGGGKLIVHSYHKQRFEAVKPLLELQEYIDSVEWSDEKINGFIDLDKFRDYAGHHNNLVEAHFKGQGIVDDGSWRDGWLTLPERKKVFPSKRIAVINRTTNYADPNFDWSNEVEYLKSISDDVFFLGYYDEWRQFQNTFNVEVNFTNVDFLDAAYLMQEAVAISCGYSCMATIAQGLGLSYRLEQAPGHTCSSLLMPRETIINV